MAWIYIFYFNSLNHQSPLVEESVEGEFCDEPLAYGVVLINGEQLTVHFNNFLNISLCTRPTIEIHGLLIVIIYFMVNLFGEPHLKMRNTKNLFNQDDNNILTNPTKL